MDKFEERVQQMTEWFASPRFKGIVRLYSPRQVVEQRGTHRRRISHRAQRRRGLLLPGCESCLIEGKSITTFGPYSPGQAVTIKRLGIEGIYLGGWATSAKGSITEDPGADLASYPLSQVPDEAAAIVRALLTADKNQHLRAFAHDRRTARRSAGTRLPPIHHCRCRHRSRRRRSCAQPDSPLR